MSPGLELDKTVCEIVGIPSVPQWTYSFTGIKQPPRPDKYFRVSQDFKECEPVLEWLRGGIVSNVSKWKMVNWIGQTSSTSSSWRKNKQ